MIEPEYDVTAEGFSGSGQTGPEGMETSAAPGVQSHDGTENPAMPEYDLHPGGTEAGSYGSSSENGEDSRVSEDTNTSFEQEFQAAIADHVEGAVQHRLLAHNLMHAQSNYGREFEAAYEAVLESGSKALVQHVLSQNDPGESMVHWYRQARMLSEIPDGDVDAWVRQRYAELSAGGNSAHVRPPPSLVGARGAGQAFSESIPENAFSYAFGK